MVKPEDHEIDTALEALAKDMQAATPAPDEDLRARVLTDGALEALAQEALGVTPRPGPDLIARVLADAAQVASDAPAPDTPVLAPAPNASQGGFFDMLFGWTGGAVAAMALCLSVGVSVGMEIDAENLPIVSEADDGDIMISAEGDLLPEEIL